MKYFFWPVVGLCIISASPCHAASGTEGASFLDIPVGARPAALGSAYTALAADAYAPVWNPAGLGFVRDTEVAGQHLDYLESIYDEYLGLAQPLGPAGLRGALGASMQYLGSGSIASTDNNGNSLGNYSSHFASYNLAYGYALAPAVSLGITGKWIDERIGDFSAHAYAADVAAMIRPNSAWSFGASVTNIGSKLTFLYSGDALPLAGHLSAAWRPAAEWTLTGEAVQSAQGTTSARGGVEWRPISALALRAGYRSDTTQELSALAGMSAGLGLSLWGSELSYAWLPMSDLGSSQYISLVVRFGEGAERENLAGTFSTQAVRNPYLYHPYDSDREAEIQDIVNLLTAPAKEALAAAAQTSPEGLR